MGLGVGSRWVCMHQRSVKAPLLQSRSFRAGRKGSLQARSRAWSQVLLSALASLPRSRSGAWSTLHLAPPPEALLCPPVLLLGCMQTFLRCAASSAAAHTPLAAASIRTVRSTVRVAAAACAARVLL